MRRRQFIFSSLVGLLMSQISTNKSTDGDTRLKLAAERLDQAVRAGHVKSAVIDARIGEHRLQNAFGSATLDSAFLLGSISKPICVAALMSLFDKHAFKLTDPVNEYVPEFKGGKREQVTIQHLLTHTSGLPDQLPNNADLRKNHAPLSTFVELAMQVPLSFTPGTRYEYSSMAILLATEIAQRITGDTIHEFVNDSVFKPLGMQHSALGIGSLAIHSTVPVQIEHAAPEAGGGDPTAKLWDWNSRYWRELGAPWGGAHASASDVATFLDAFVNTKEQFLPAATAKLMIQNHNAASLEPRGLGFALGTSLCKNCTATAFGHTGSTGTIAFVDRQRDIHCVVLTSLPGQAMKPHPRELAAECL